MSQVVVHIGTRQMRHSHYVAFSRVTSISGLHILQMNPTKISVDPQVQIEMARLRTQHLLQLCYSPTYMFNAPLKITFINARSLHLHFDDLQSDHNHQHADIIAVAETRLISTDSDQDYALTNYNLIRADQTRTSSTHSHLPIRPPHGLAAYVRKTMITINAATSICTETI